MAAARVKNGTLSSATVKTETLDDNYLMVEVLNRDGTSEIFITTDGTSPTVGGDNCYCIGPKSSLQLKNFLFSNGNPTVVKLISSGTPTYSVEGMSAHDIHRSSTG